MDTYFLYARKSTDEPDRQILSIKAQITELKEYAEREQLTIKQTFIESQTAKEPGRPIFNDMLSLVEKGCANGILAWHPDRLARNSVDGGRVIYLTDTGKLTMLKFPTFWFDATPQGKFMLNIAFGQSKYYVDNLSENVKRGLRQKVRRGEAIGVAPTGYLNDLVNHRMVKDPERFRLVRKVFEMYATGSYSLKGLREIIFDMGLVSRKGKKLSNSNIQKILTNPMYYGAFLSNGELFPGIHEPCVSKKLFDTVQTILTSKTCPKKRGVKLFPLRGLFACGECGCSITAESKKGHSYYRCTKKKDGIKCSQRYIREELLTEQINEMIQKVSLPKDWADEMLGQLEKDQSDTTQSDALFAQKTKIEIKAHDDKLDTLLDAHLEQAISREEYTAKKNKVLSQKMDLEQKLKDFERKGNAWLELSRKFILTAHQAENVALEENLFVKKDFLKKHGSNRLLAERKVAVGFEGIWKILYDFKSNPDFSRGVLEHKKAPEGRDSAFLFANLGEKDSNLHRWLQRP